MELEVNRTCSAWAPPGKQFWVTNVIHNWYPGNNLNQGLEWWARVPQGERGDTASRERKLRRKTVSFAVVYDVRIERAQLMPLISAI